MKDEDFRQKIVDSHPLLYRAGMSFECGDGWLQIISDLSDQLEAELESIDTQDRWEPLPYAVQVKEKFGLLRFYMGTATNEMYKYIEDAEEKSGNTCEVCGEPGLLRGGCWLFTACDVHA